VVRPRRAKPTYTTGLLIILGGEAGTILFLTAFIIGTLIARATS